MLISFDIITDFGRNREELKMKLLNEIKQKYPQFTFIISDDYDF